MNTIYGNEYLIWQWSCARASQCIRVLQGDQCQLCDKLSVGNATNGGVCESCFTVCNNHASVCMDNTTKQGLLLQINQSLTDAVSGSHLTLDKLLLSFVLQSSLSIFCSFIIILLFRFINTLEVDDHRLRLWINLRAWGPSLMRSTANVVLIGPPFPTPPSPAPVCEEALWLHSLCAAT